MKKNSIKHILWLVAAFVFTLSCSDRKGAVVESEDSLGCKCYKYNYTVSSYEKVLARYSILKFKNIYLQFLDLDSSFYIDHVSEAKPFDFDMLDDGFIYKDLKFSFNAMEGDSTLQTQGEYGFWVSYERDSIVDINEGKYIAKLYTVRPLGHSTVDLDSHQIWYSTELGVIVMDKNNNISRGLSKCLISYDSLPPHSCMAIIEGLGFNEERKYFNSK